MVKHKCACGLLIWGGAKKCAKCKATHGDLRGFNRYAGQARKRSEQSQDWRVNTQRKRIDSSYFAGPFGEYVKRIHERANP